MIDDFFSRDFPTIENSHDLGKSKGINECEAEELAKIVIAIYTGK